MRLGTTATFFCFLVPLLASSSASGELVGSLRIGAAIPSIKTGGVELDGDSGYSIDASFGLRISDFVQWDVAEIAYSSADQNGAGIGTFTASSLMFGTGIRIGALGPDSKFHPYGSFGIGGALVDFEQGKFTGHTEWGFEWSVGAGVLYDISDGKSIGARYRYRSSSYDEVSGFAILEIDINIHTIAFEIAFGG